MVAEPSPLSVKLTPGGKSPVTANDGGGEPVAWTVKEPPMPAGMVKLAGVVKTGGWPAARTVSVKVWVLSLPTPLWAVIVRRWGPSLPGSGVPYSVAVPSWLLTKKSPEGRSPVSVNPAVGEPLVVTAKLPKLPTVKLVPLSLVKAGDWPTVSTNVWAVS